MGSQHPIGWQDTLQQRKHAFPIAVIMLRVFYIYLFYYALRSVKVWTIQYEIGQLDLLWPVFWIPWFDADKAAHGVLLFSFIAILLSLVFHSFRWARVLACVGLLEYVGLSFSHGKVGHGLHLCLIISFFLIFLPRKWTSTIAVDRITRESTFQIFWACQAIILLTYSLSGLWKVLLTIYQAAIGQVHALHPSALGLHIAERLIQTNSTSLLGPWFIDHPLAGWPLMAGTIYIQFFSLCAAFRPRLHLLWGVGLILMHVGTSTTMSITFSENAFLIGIFFILSPFNASEFHLQGTLRDIPLLGLVFNAWDKHKVACTGD